MNTKKQWYMELGANLKTEFPIRNIVTPAKNEELEQFRKKYANTSIFASVFTYDTEHIRSGLKRGPLYFDFDGAYAQSDARAVVDGLLSFGCPSDSIKVLYSGNKGFHLEVPFSALNIEPSQQLHELYRSIAEHLDRHLYLSSMDSSIYDAVRLWRLTNSKHEESGLYKIPLTLSELEQPIESIRALAANPRYDFTFTEAVTWESFATIITTAKQTRISSNKSNLFDPTIEGSRNKKMFLRALVYKKDNVSFEQALIKCKQIQDIPPLPDWEIERTVYSAYQDKYKVYDNVYENAKKAERTDTIATSFIRDRDAIYEEVFDPEHGEAAFATYNNGQVSYVPHVTLNGKNIEPICDAFVTQKTILLPTKAQGYVNEEQLIDEIIGFIHQNVDVEPIWERWAAYYILLSWVYDKLPVVPYLCAVGPSNAGKTRFVQTVGQLCYKPLFVSGAISKSSVFRTLDQFRGTLIINEFDHISAYNSEVIVILNNGYEKDLPVLRVEGKENRVVTRYSVFGPKLFASRKRKNDWAFESRLITIPMQATRRKDIPPFLLDSFHEKALQLRNMLLMYRLKHYFDAPIIRNELFQNIFGRLRQTLLAMVSVIADEKFLEVANEFAGRLTKSLKETAEFDFDTVIARAVIEAWDAGVRKISFQKILHGVRESTGQDYLSYRSLSAILRDELGLLVKRSGSNGNYEAFISEKNVETLKELYGYNTKITEETEATEANINTAQRKEFHE